MQIETKSSFIKDLKEIPKETRLKVAEVINDLEQAKSLASLACIKKLKGHHNFYRIRIGNYRLGFALEGETVILVRFLPRKDIYRFFP